MPSNQKYLKEIDTYVNQLEELAGMEVVVGIPASKNKIYTDVSGGGKSPTLVQIGAKHEYGSPKENIPQRSFLRVPLQNNVNNMFKRISKDLKFSKIDATKALGRLGANGVSVVLEAFKTGGNGSWQPLKPYTVSKRRKGSNQPLVDTGQLRQSITWEVRKK